MSEANTPHANSKNRTHRGTGGSGGDNRNRRSKSRMMKRNRRRRRRRRRKGQDKTFSSLGKKREVEKGKKGRGKRERERERERDGDEDDVPSVQQSSSCEGKAENPCRGPVRVGVQCAPAQSATAVATHSLTNIGSCGTTVKLGGFQCRPVLSFLPSFYQDPPVPVLKKFEMFSDNFVSSSFFFFNLNKNSGSGSISSSGNQIPVLDNMGLKLEVNCWLTLKFQAIFLSNFFQKI